MVKLAPLITDLLRVEGTPIAPSGIAVDLHAARWAASGRGQDAQPSLFD